MDPTLENYPDRVCPGILGVPGDFWAPLGVLVPGRAPKIRELYETTVTGHFCHQSRTRRTIWGVESPNSSGNYTPARNNPKP